jgi:hypothetical protein
VVENGEVVGCERWELKMFGCSRVFSLFDQALASVVRQNNKLLYTMQWRSNIVWASESHLKITGVQFNILVRLRERILIRYGSASSGMTRREANTTANISARDTSNVWFFKEVKDSS